MYKIFAIAILALLTPQSVGAQPFDYAYTKHDYQKCKVVGDEDPVLETLCQGYAGIPVRWLNEPDSSSIFFGDEPAPDDTYDERFTFAVVENTIEWRGPRKAGRIEPFATIVRFQLCRSIGGPCRPELVLFRLEGKRRSCLAASVDGTRADANKRARTLADSFVRGFRCGTDTRRPPE
ncbi:MAG TPA: hypothetical protein VIG34_06145 [Xanthobacteraceae bacterium]|jgi:hypothetical protein